MILHIIDIFWPQIVYGKKEITRIEFICYAWEVDLSDREGWTKSGTIQWGKGKNNKAQCGGERVKKYSIMWWGKEIRHILVGEGK